MPMPRRCVPMLVVALALTLALPFTPSLHATPAAQATIEQDLFKAEPFGDSVDQSRAVAVGDVNGDGALDMVIGNGHHGYFNVGVVPTAPSEVIFNDGRGGIAKVLPLPRYQNALNATTSVALGDLNGDGALDIVLGGALYVQYQYACLHGASISTSLVYLNDGQGGFPEATPLVLGDPVTSVALGDLNGDGALDLVTAVHGDSACSGKSKVYLNRNDGSGSFAPTPIELGDSLAQSVALGDLDSDGDLDVVIGNGVVGIYSAKISNTIYINQILQNSATPFVRYEVVPPTDAFGAAAVALGDLDGDRDLDLVVGNYGGFDGGCDCMGGALSAIYYNQGDGRFDSTTQVARLPLVGTVRSVALADMNDDGALDIVTANGRAPYGVNESGYRFRPNLIYMNRLDSDGRPSGRFEPEQVRAIDSRNNTQSLAIADLDGDGALDIVAANPLERNTIYRNLQGGHFSSPLVIDRQFAPRSEGVAVGDIDGDGWMDLLLLTGSNARLYRNTGDGAFEPARVIHSGTNLLSMALGDLDRDGSIDIVFGRSAQAGLVLLNPNAGQNFTPQEFGPPDAAFSALTLGDFDGDQWLDIAAGAKQPAQPTARVPSWIFRNAGAGRFPQTQAQPLTGHQHSASALAPADFDSDGDLDLAASGRQSVLYRNDGSGILRLWQTLNTTMGSAVFEEGTESVSAADFDSDGDSDLAFGVYAIQSAIYQNDGKGIFTNASPYFGTNATTLALAAGDLNGDGQTDLLSANDRSPGLVAHLNDGGRFARSVTLNESGALGVAVADLNRDGPVDLVVLKNNGINADLEVFWNQAGRPVGMLNTGPQVSVMRPGPTDEAPFFSSPVLLSDQIIPVSYTLSDADGDLAHVRAEYSLDGGGTWQPALPTQDTPTQNLATRRLLPDRGTQQFPLTIADAGQISDLDLSLNISHRAVGQLRAALIAPDGTRVELFGGVGGAGRDFTQTGFDDEASTPISAGSAPFRGSYVPQQSLAAFDGKDIAGVWTLELTDDALGTSGFLTAWSLRVTTLKAPSSLVAPVQPMMLTDLGDSESTVEVLTNATVTDLDVALSMAHSYVSDMDVWLEGPDGTQVLLFSAVGEDGDNFTDTILDDEAIDRIGEDTTTAPFSGRFKPATALSAFDGKNTRGIWKLLLRDTYSGDQGELLSWSVQVESTAGPLRFNGGSSQAIPDAGILELPLAAQPGEVLSDVDVELSVRHPAVSQLRGRLIGPNGNTTMLFPTLIGAGADMVGTVFDDQAATPIGSGNTPFSGRFRPAEPLARLNGQTTEPIWLLQIEDTTSGEMGVLTDVKLTLRSEQVRVYDSHPLLAAAHVFRWDTFASQLFGQSDTALFRIIATPSLKGLPDRPAGRYMRPYIAASSTLFRVRGSQVRVVNEQNQPMAGAIVLRRSAKSSGQADLIADSAGQPFITDAQGYLRGRGSLGPGDMLFALAPVPISATAPYSLSATLYHTNLRNHDGSAVGSSVGAAGLQTISVAAAHPLLLFHLDVSLEWDARYDTRYMAQLQYDLRRASEFLFDATNGQAALGDINIWHDKENWDFAPIRVYASNRVRPSAVLGGVSSEPISRTIQGGGELYFGPGQLRMGATWNRFGNAGSNLGEDWARTLAHELGHYLFFLDDNYLGYDAQGQVVQVASCPGLMGDPYISLELRPDADWLVDAAGKPTCGSTFSNATYRRSDWATVRAFYPQLVAPSAPFSDPALLGPSSQPLGLTTIISNNPITPTARLAVPIFYTKTSSGGTYLPSNRARAYLFQDSWTDNDSLVDRMTDLGRVTQDQILARGARVGDRLCLFDPADAGYGCETLVAEDETLTVRQRADWQPDIRVTPVTSLTLTISVTVGTPLSAPLKARIYPLDNIAGAPAITLVSGAPAADGSITYTGLNTTPEPLAGAYIHLYVDEGGARREAVTSYAMGGNPGLLRSGGGLLRSGPGLLRSGGGLLRSGGGLLRSGGGLLRSGPGLLRSGGGLLRSGGAPVSSAEGDLLLVDDDLTFAEGQFLVIQSATELPTPPDWARLVGRAYRLSTSTAAIDLSGGRLSFGYPGAEVPADEEAGITIYYVAPGGTAWVALPTNVDPYHNLASAPSRGPGLYALMSSLRLPALSRGWNLLAYPGANQPVATALGYLAGSYTTVYSYRPNDPADPWKVYGATVPAAWQPIVNDLDALSQGSAYWIRATREITPLIRGARDGAAGPTSLAAQTPDSTGLSLPSATYYGIVPGVAAANAASVRVEARINGTLCGAATARQATLSGRHVAAVVIDVRAAGAGADGGCGVAGTPVSFTFLRGGTSIRQVLMAWNNDEVLPLAGQQTFLPLVLRP